MYAKFSFTVDEDAILIANVKRNPFIFDRNDIRHKDSRLKDDVWADISDQVGRTIIDCKKRWRNIRDTYLKQLKKYSSGSASARRRRRKSSHLSFLDNIEYEKIAASNEDSRDFENYIVNETEIKTEPEDDHNMDQDESDRQPSPDIPSTSNGRKRGTKKEKLSAVIAKRPKNDKLLPPPPAVSIQQATGASKQHEDAVDIFFKSIAMTVKNLPQRAINMAKLQILTLVNQLEENYATHPQLE